MDQGGDTVLLRDHDARGCRNRHRRNQTARRPRDLSVLQRTLTAAAGGRGDPRSAQRAFSHAGRRAPLHAFSHAGQGQPPLCCVLSHAGQGVSLLRCVLSAGIFCKNNKNLLFFREETCYNPPMEA